MFKKKKIIAIIPARGGSKRLVNKNIIKVNNKRLIEFTIESALKSKLIDKIFVSTDSKKIRDISKNCGLEVPFMRPSIFAKDRSPTHEAVIHTLNEFKKIGEEFDYIALLEPTSPLRKQHDIDKAIKKLINNKDADTLVSLGKIHLEQPKIIKKLSPKRLVKPYFTYKFFPEAYFPYGVIYLSKVRSFYKKKTFYSNKTISYFIERWQNYEVDDLLDLKIVENILKIREKNNG